MIIVGVTMRHFSKSKIYRTVQNASAIASSVPLLSAAVFRNSTGAAATNGNHKIITEYHGVTVTMTWRGQYKKYKNTKYFMKISLWNEKLKK